jgi:hypothetical protein
MASVQTEKDLLTPEQRELSELRAENERLRKLSKDAIRDVIVLGVSGDLFRIPLDATRANERPDTVRLVPVQKHSTPESAAALEYAAAQAGLMQRE